MDEQRYPFSAKRITVTEVHGYVEAADPVAAAELLRRNRGLIEIEAVGPILEQTFTDVQIAEKPLRDDE